MLLSRFVVGMLSVGLMVLGASVVSGQDYPNKPIRIVTSSPGGSSDFAARVIAQGISGPLGQPVIADNRVALMSAEIVAKASPDGYSLLVSGGNLWITPLLQKVSYDAVREFSPISLLWREVAALVVHPSLPVKSVKELIALAKAKPGVLNIAASAAGGVQHLGAELFKFMTGVNIVSITYKGAAAPINAVLGNEVQLLIIQMSLVAQHVESGKLRALAVASAEPSALAPGLPTMAASGLPGYEMFSRQTISAPAKTPRAIIDRLNQEIVRVIKQPEVKKRLNPWVEVVASTPEELAAVVKSDLARMSKLIKDAGIKYY